MKLKAALDKALEDLRSTIAKADGSEAEVLSAFSDAIGSEVEGWDMRLQELREEEEDEED